MGGIDREHTVIGAIRSVQKQMQAGWAGKEAVFISFSLYERYKPSTSSKASNVSQ
jgi:hypothetical protein